MKKPSKIQQRLAGTYRSPVQKQYGLKARVIPKEQPIDLSKQHVIYMSRSDVHSYEFGENDILISISNSDAEMPELKHKPKDFIAVHFDDYASAMDVKMGMRGFSSEDAEAIAQFLKRITGTPNLIVHCNYGESRSRAVAIAIAETMDIEPLTLSSEGKLIRHRECYGSGNQRVFYLLYRALSDHFDS